MSERFKICSLYSGSSGNSLYVESREARILIDAGKSARALRLALDEIGVSIESIDAIFITHEHIDHTSALSTVSKKYGIPIHATDGCAMELSARSESVRPFIISHPPVYEVTVGDLTVSSFLISHDAACPVGYKFTAEGFEAAGVMTDTGIVTNSAAAALCGCRDIVLESNHDRQMLADGPYPYSLKERVGSRFGHLSNELSARFSAYLAENGAKSFLLAHLSGENNTPKIALAAHEPTADRGCSVRVASPCAPTFLE